MVFTVDIPTAWISNRPNEITIRVENFDPDWDAPGGLALSALGFGDILLYSETISFSLAADGSQEVKLTAIIEATEPYFILRGEAEVEGRSHQVILEAVAMSMPSIHLPIVLR